MTGGHRHSQYCLKISGIPSNAWFPQLTVTYTWSYTVDVSCMLQIMVGQALQLFVYTLPTYIYSALTIRIGGATFHCLSRVDRVTKTLTSRPYVDQQQYWWQTQIYRAPSNWQIQGSCLKCIYKVVRTMWGIYSLLTYLKRSCPDFSMTVICSNRAKICTENMLVCIDVYKWKIVTSLFRWFT